MHTIELSEPQTDFILSDAKFPLFVAGFGSGKSTTMCVSMFNDLSLPSKEPISLGAYAPTYDLLTLITIPYIEEFLQLMDVPYKLNKRHYIITLESGDKIICRSLDNPSRIVGYEVFRSHIDEIDTLVEKKAEEAWNKVIARNRQRVYVYDEDWNIVKKEDGAPQNQMNRVSAYTTPEGFRFAYKRWYKNPVDGYEMIKASTYSNMHNLPDDYIESLRRTYPEGLVDAYIEGEFVNLIGSNVYRGFDRELNASDANVRDGDILEVGMDFNVVHGACVIHVLRNGNPVAVDEIHDAYDTDEQIKILRKRYPNNPINVYPDATGTHRTSANTTESDIQKLKAAKFKVFHNHVNPPIKDRIMSFNAMISNGKGERKYKVNIDNCPNLVNSLEQQIWNKNGMPDKENGLDHIVDGAGYYISYRFGITKPKSKVTSSYHY